MVVDNAADGEALAKPKRFWRLMQLLADTEEMQIASQEEVISSDGC